MFTIRNLSVLSYAQGFTLWHYKARAPLAAMMAPGFMTPATNTFNVGDMILATGTDGGAVVVVAACAGPLGAHDVPVLLAPLMAPPVGSATVGE